MWARVWGRGTLISWWWVVHWIAIWGLLQKANLELSCDLVVPHVSMGPKDSTFCSWDPGASVLIAASFTGAGKWGQPKCSSAEEQIIKVCTNTQWNCIRVWREMKFAGKHMEPENIMMSEETWAQKAERHVVSLIRGSKLWIFNLNI